MRLGRFCMQLLLFCSRGNALLNEEGEAFKKKKMPWRVEGRLRWEGYGGAGLQKNNQRSFRVSSSIIDFHMQVSKTMTRRGRRGGRISSARNINNSHVFKCIHLSQLFFFTLSVIFLIICMYIKLFAHSFRWWEKSLPKSYGITVLFFIFFKKRLQQYGNVLSSGTLPGLTLYKFIPPQYIFIY